MCTVKAAQLGARVAVVEVKKSFGGPTGLTSKAVREAAKRIVKTVEQVSLLSQTVSLWTFHVHYAEQPPSGYNAGIETGLRSDQRPLSRSLVSDTFQVGGDRTRQIRRLWTKRFPALKSEAEVFQAAETRDRLTKNACDLYVGAALLVKNPWDDR